MITIIFSVAVAVAKLCSHNASSFSAPTSLLPISSTRPSPSGPLLYHEHEYQRPNSRHPSKLYSNNNMSNDNALLKNLLSNDAGDDKDPYSRYTHQIAIPLQDTSELHSALTAIQTSLVRDCPRLIRACVMPALLRMPLLYVDGSSLENGNVLGGSSDGRVDAILEEVVHRAIKEVAYGEETAEPILLPFRGLELQGEDNSVLYAVGNNVNDESSGKKKQKDQLQDVEDEEDGVIIVDSWSTDIPPIETNNGPSGWEILEKLVLNIQNELESKHGLKTCWPLDKPQGEEVELEYEDPLVAAIKRNQQKWRPRVPFVRLPNDFYQDLEADLEQRRNSIKDSDEDEDEPSLMDMGFDGISPLFWYEAWGEEDILEAPGVRMQSVAVYRRMVPGGGEAESSFYVPTSSSGGGGPQPWKTGASTDGENSGNSMELPAGDAKLRARERREMAKSMERLGDEEQRAEREWEQGKARWMEDLSESLDGGNGETKMPFDEDSLAQFDVGMEMGEVTVEGDAAYSTPWIKRGTDEQPEEIMSGEPNTTEETVISVDTGLLQGDTPKTPQLSDIKPRRELPSIEDNPIFQRLRNRQAQVTSQGQNTALDLDGTPPTTDEPLPPYPSDAHFVGAWRVVSSPLGTDIDDAESKSSDNFILRVDGQVMGGPVLDTKYQHKAAGGEWKMFQAMRKSVKKSESEDESSLAPPAVQTRIRIRLLVPPEKDRALVMEGEVTRLSISGVGDAASPSSEGWMMASGGMLDGMLENIDDAQSQSEAESGEGLLYCGGEAWMEDVEGGENRRKLGPFSLMKLETMKRENLIYTVDIAKPTAEEENEDDEE